MPHLSNIARVARAGFAVILWQAMTVVLQADIVVAAPLNCSPTDASGKPTPPTVTAKPTDAFQIFWHIGTQIEALADAPVDSEARKQIANVQKNVDGYYITIFPNQLGYWPQRPDKCAMNFMRLSSRAGIDAAQALRESCNSNFAATLNGKDKNKDTDDRGTTKEIYRDALHRVLSNLDIEREQSRGKMVISQMLLTNTDFKYDNASAKLILERLPTAYCYLNAAGISVNNVLAYQEPRPQTRSGRLLMVPRPGSHKAKAGDRRAILPFNLNLVEQLSQSFSDAHVPLSRFSINVRRWNKRMAVALAAKPQDEHIGGVFFEGGTEIISTKRRSVPRIDNFAEGIAWLLANSDEDVFLLMPGFWEKDQLKSDEDRDELIPRLRETVMMLNHKIEQRLASKPAKPAICNGRLHFIPGTYGSPSHVEPLPPERNGKLAGTVSGEIMLLAQMRREMCGVHP